MVLKTQQGCMHCPGLHFDCIVSYFEQKSLAKDKLKNNSNATWIYIYICDGITTMNCNVQWIPWDQWNLSRHIWDLGEKKPIQVLIALRCHQSKVVTSVHYGPTSLALFLSLCSGSEAEPERSLFVKSVCRWPGCSQTLKESSYFLRYGHLQKWQ